MLYWEEQGENYALRQCDANGQNKRQPLILAGTSEIVLIPQRRLCFPIFVLRPQGAAVGTIDLCHEWDEDVRAFLNGGSVTLIWDPSVLGNVTAASTDDGKRLEYSGTVSAVRFTAASGNVRLAGTC